MIELIATLTLFHTTVFAADVARCKQTCAVNREQILVIAPTEFFQHVASLKRAMHGAKSASQRGGIHRIEYLAHLRITRCLLDTEERCQIMLYGAGIGLHVSIELQQRAILEAEHGQSRAERVTHGVLHTTCTSSIRYRIKSATHGCHQAFHR